MRSVEVQMQDGSTLLVHGLKTDKMGLFMRAMPSLKALGGTLSGNSLMTDEEMAPVFAMLAEMAGLTEQQFRELDLFDGLAVLAALNAILPVNFMTPVRNSTSLDGKPG